MLVPWTEQKPTQRVFFLQQLKPTFPLNLMPWSCSASVLSLPHPRGVSLLCVTLPASFVMVLPSLSHVLSQTKPAGAEPSPLWHPHLGFCSSEWLTSAVGWHLDDLAQPWWTVTMFALLTEPKKRCRLHHLTLTRPAAESVWWQSLKSSCITPIDKRWFMWMLMKFKCHECTVSFGNC